MPCKLVPLRGPLAGTVVVLAGEHWLIGQSGRFMAASKVLGEETVKGGDAEAGTAGSREQDK